MYFETDDNTVKGVCCVCYKKGVLGRCPNPECGLLMHLTCVPSAEPGKGQECPVCKTERRVEQEKPLWHEAEVGAKSGSVKSMMKKEGKEAPFPVVRWPTKDEANLHGYASVEDWYVDFRGRGLDDPGKVAEWRAEYKVEKSRRAPKEEDSNDDRVDAFGSTDSPMPLGTAETGRRIAKPYQIADSGPLTWKRVEQLATVREALTTTLKQKWAESTSGPDKAMTGKLEAMVPDFRLKLIEAQKKCKDGERLLKALTVLLTAKAKESVKEAQDTAKDYRLHPVDGMLERKVLVARAMIWVPYMPGIILEQEDGDRGKTWRRWAFEMAHCTFLEPHRPSGPTWQTLKRIAFWQTMHKDSTHWMYVCAVCQQYRSVGQMAPMRSMLASIPEIAKLPWADVIIDCQGPFTRSAKGNCYTVSYHCTMLGVPKVEAFEKLTKACFKPLKK